MKIINDNIRKGEAKIKIENQDDFWYLTTIIDPGDLIKGKTLRKIKIGEKEDRSNKVVKKPVFIALKVEKVEFAKTTEVLRVSGVVVDGPEDIPHGSHHTFNVEEGTIITISKEKWLKFQIDRLKDACSDEVANILVCVLDREEAYFALLKKYGYSLLSNLKGDVAKKGNDEKVSGSFYSEVIKNILEYDRRYNFSQIIIGSPAFWKEDLLKELKDPNLKKRLVLATCSSVDKTAINEVLKRPETKEALKKARSSKEERLVEELLNEISRAGAVTYGMKETENASNSGAVKILLVTDKLIHTLRSDGKYAGLDSVMRVVDSSKGEIHIISSENDAGKKLDGLGGIGALLRYKMNY